MKVELHIAYQWDCENCGEENFCRAVTYEPSPEVEEELRREYAIHDSAKGYEQISTGGNWVTRPNKVKCSHCGEEFEAREAGEGGEMSNLDEKLLDAKQVSDRDKCTSCGKSWVDHNGIQKTCAELQETRKQLAAAKALLAEASAALVDHHELGYWQRFEKNGWTCPVCEKDSLYRRIDQALQRGEYAK